MVIDDGRITKIQPLTSAEFEGVGRVTISAQFTALKGVLDQDDSSGLHPVSAGPGHKSLECIYHDQHSPINLSRAWTTSPMVSDTQRCVHI